MKKVTMTFIVTDETFANADNEMTWGNNENAAEILSTEAKISYYDVKEVTEKKKNEVVYVFGSYAVEAYDEGLKELRKCLNNGDGSLIRREFNTEEERNAYQMGLNDMNGWEDWCCLSDDDVKNNPRMIKKYA